MTDLIPIVRPVRTPADLEAIKAAAAQDDHEVLFPTHLAEREGQVVGYGGILPHCALINVWLDSTRVRARDSMYLLNLIENLAYGTGAQRLVMPCATDSPFYQYMEKFGYQRLGLSSVNLKG